jgi:hypothetical protein
MPVLSKKAPCPCGSGKKYKHCHWDEHHPAGSPGGVENGALPASSTEGTGDLDRVEAPSRARSSPIVIAVVLVVTAAIALGAFYESAKVGWAVGLAGLLSVAIYAIARNPPPPAPRMRNTAFSNRGGPDLQPPTRHRS